MSKARNVAALLLALLLSTVPRYASTASVFVWQPTPTPLPAASQETKALPQQMSIPLNWEDQKITMPKNTLSYWFYVPEGVQLSGECTLRLHFTYSVSFIETLCSLTVHLNEMPLESYPFDEEGKHSVYWEVKFDSSLMKPGQYNTIRLDSVQRSIEGECADIDNPGNWMLLHKDSALELSYDPSLYPDVAEFYGLFMEALSSPFAIEHDFILSKPYRTDIIGAMLGIAGATGMHYPSRQFVSYRALETPDLSEKNAILLQQDPSGPGDMLTVSIQGAQEGAPHYLMRILGDSAQSFSNAAAFFYNRTLLESIEQRSILVTNRVPAQGLRQVTELNDTGIYTFKAMGMSDIQQTGTFHHRTRLNFVQPGGVKGESGSYLDVRFRHSAALLSDRSQLTVLINGVQIASVKLSVANMEDGQLLVPIPDSALESPEINVDFETYHYLGKVDCTKDYYDVAWTVIDAAKSKICLVKGEQGVRASLKGFPFFYGSDPAVRLYLPGEANASHLECAAAMAARAGQNTRLALEWTVLREDIRGSNTYPPQGDTLVVIARRDQARLPAEIADQLAVVPVENGWRIREDLLLASEALLGKVILQVVRSPWAFQQKIYLVLYDDEAYLSYFYKLLSDREKLNTLDGQLALIGKNGNVQAFITDPLDPGSDKVPLGLTDYVKKVENFTNMPWWVLLLIVLISLALLMMMIRLIRRRYDEYKHAAKIHKGSQGFDEKKSDGDTDEQ